MTQIMALDGGHLYVPTLTTAYLPSPTDEYNFFLQSRCYLYADQQTAARLKITFSFGLQVNSWYVYPDVNGNAYIPLNDVLAYSFQRQSLDTIGLVSSYGTIDVDAVDADGNTLDSVGMSANIYDCIGLRGGYASAGFDHLLPDTFRIPKSIAYNEYVNIGCRLTHGVNLVQLTSGGNTYTYWQAKAGGEAVGVTLKSKGVPTTLRAYEDSLTPDDAAMVGDARFELVDCLTDKLILTWWSVEDGFYKTRVADIVSGGVNQMQSVDYIHAFDDYTSKDNDVYAVGRFASLTQRDWEYYKDLLMSDEVWLVSSVDTMDDLAQIEKVPVRIEGGIPQRKGQTTTIDFNIVYNQYSEL